jgi:glycosyltransferase involved in cell wall biosynthesis
MVHNLGIKYSYTVSDFGVFDQAKKPVYFVNAYAVSPIGGSEPGIGFAWFKELLKHFSVVLFTESEFKSDIVKWLKTQQSVSCRIYFIDVGENARLRCWNQGNWRFYLDYWRYQITVLSLASYQIKHTKPIYLHQLNMIGFREPGYFWFLSLKYDTPLIWGPIGGYNFISPKFYMFYGLRYYFAQSLKNTLNLFSFLLQSVIFSFFIARFLLLAIPVNPSRLIYRIRKPIFFSETFLREVHDLERINFLKLSCNSILTDNFTGYFNVMTVGKLVPRKLVDLVIESLTRGPLKNASKIRLHIIGDGHCSDLLKHLIKIKSLDKKVFFYGKLPHDEVLFLLNKANLLVHASIDEGLASVICESLSLKKNVIAFDCSGTKFLKELNNIKLMPYPKNRDDAILKISKEIFNHIKTQSLTIDTKENSDIFKSWLPEAKINSFLSFIGIKK